MSSSGRAWSLGQSARGMRCKARIAAARSRSSSTNGASAANVLASWPRTWVRAIIAAWRTATAGSAWPTCSVHARARSLDVVLAKDFVAVVVEHREREAVEPLAEIAVGAVVDHDRFDRQLCAQIDFPPGIGRVFLGVRLAAVAVLAARVAVDRAARRRRRWPCSSAMALPCRATLWPPLVTSTSASVSVPLRGSSIRT